MEVFEAIKGRRSIRRFEKREVTDEMLAKILEAATYAPSSGNLQNWEFVVVRDEERKRKIAEIALGQSFIAEASVVVVVCSNDRKILRYGERGKRLYSIQNTL